MIARSRFFSVRKEPDFTTVRLDGGVSDSQLAEELMHQLATFIDDVGPVKLLVDFVDVESCPSAVIAALIAAQRRSEALGGQMKLSIPSDRIRAVFQRLNLNLLFDIYANRDDAICVCRDETNSN
jgi:anti-anti-sigma factor